MIGFSIRYIICRKSLFNKEFICRHYI